MNEATTPSRQSAGRIGQHLKSGLSNYIDHWQEWIVPTLVAGAFVVVSIFCCWFPYLIVVGPVTCGMYCCALKALRGGSLDTNDLNRGWHAPGRSILAALVINFGMMLPMFLLYIVMFACFGLFVALVPQPSGGPDHMESREYQQGAEVADNTDRVPEPEDATRAEAEEVPPDDVSNQPERPDARQRQVPDQQPNGRAEEPPPEAIFGMIAAMFLFYALLFLAIIVCWLWMMWFGTRTMFVFPLIADRQLSFGTAWNLSWQETRVRFWELLIINFVAGLLGMLGMYAMYIGLIFTMPIMFSIVVSVYDERFPLKQQAEGK